MNSEHYEKYKELYKSRAKVHREDRLYNTYLRMCERCSKGSKNPKYKTYRDRDIKVEFSGPEHFREWSLGNGYKDGLTIDREDAYKNYSPSNCRWITLEENSGRATAKEIVRSDGQEYPSIKQASRENGVSDTAIRNAIKKDRKSAGYYWQYKCDTIMV